MQAQNTVIIHCKALIFAIGTWTIALLPKSASAKLPSRGMTLVKGTINDHPFTMPLEPDGRGSHWLRLDKTMLEGGRAKVGTTVTLVMESSKEWPEPTLPADLKAALAGDPEANALWLDVTPMARWDWIRWIRATNNPETRKRHIEVAFSKLKHGIRRPCCFNRNMCTEPSVSKNGVLLEPTAAT